MGESSCSLHVVDAELSEQRERTSLSEKERI